MATSVVQETKLDVKSESGSLDEQKPAFANQPVVESNAIRATEKRRKKVCLLSSVVLFVLSSSLNVRTL